MEILAKISKGTKMDQVYIPKARIGMPAGSHVLILPLASKLKKQQQFKPYFYKIKRIEPIKLKIIEEVFNLIDNSINPENIIITGSFLEKGFSFNDLDILLIAEKEINAGKIQAEIEKSAGIKAHILVLTQKALLSGLSYDPIYSLMLSKFVSKKRFIAKVRRKINYHLLDLSLLKSKTLIDNFEILGGKEKYYLTLNIASILLFIQNQKLSKEIINKKIEKDFGIEISKLKDNLLEKQKFLKKYKEIYDKTFKLILSSIKEEK